MTHWVIAYDIRCHRRRARVARRLEREGLRVQKSVFVVDKTVAELLALMRGLKELIDPDTDQIAAWRLSQPSAVPRAQAGLPAGPLYRETLVW